MAIISCYDLNGDAIRFLTQWDHNISIRATGVKTSPIPEFRFSNKNSQKSKCISGVVVGDGVKATIPNGFLQEALPIYVQLFYTYPSGDAKTEHTFVIPVKPASMPDGAVYEPVEVRSVVELEKRVKALEENGVPGAGGVPSNPSFDTVSLGGDAGVVIIPEGNADAPAITFYGAHGDEPVALNNVADAIDDRSATNLGQVKEMIKEAGIDPDGIQTTAKPAYIAQETAPADHTVLWVDTGDHSRDETGHNVYYRPAQLMDGSYHVLGINHRGYSYAAPENTIPAYIKSKEMGFNYVEADVCFTADGVAVLLHDSTIDRTSNGSGNIGGMTYAEAAKYDFGSWKAAEYAGTRIPTFEEFIILCKRIGLHPYIELKPNGAYTQAQIQCLAETVRDCGMEGRVTWISFDWAFLSYVKAVDSCARLGYLVSNVTDAVIATAQGLQTGSNEVFIDSCDYGAAAVALCKAAGLPLEIWTINDAAVIKSMPPYITGVTSDYLVAGKVLHDAGMEYSYGTENMWIAGKFHFRLSQGKIGTAQVGGAYLDEDLTRAGYTGVACTVTPGKRYRLVGVDGVRYGIQTITESGYSKVIVGETLSWDGVTDKIDSGWQYSGYEFAAADTAACVWVTSSFEDNTNITPEQAMPVYLEAID